LPEEKYVVVDELAENDRVFSKLARVTTCQRDVAV
jgi:hypothetical protein